MTRRLLVAVTVVLPAPAPAQAGVVALEGTQLAYHADPGEMVRLGVVQPTGGQIAFVGDVRAGAGCAQTEPREVECPEAGVTGVAVHSGDGDDRVGVGTRVAVTMVLGGGRDTFWAQSSGAITVDAGPGDDRGSIDGTAQPVALAGGDGDDQLELAVGDLGDGPFAVDGGAGDDALVVRHDGPSAATPGGLRPGMAAPVAIACGPGADRWTAGPYDLPGDGCAPSLTGVTTASISRAFREGTLTGPASGSVTLRRMNDWGTARERIARGTYSARGGPLRVSLRPTKAGRDRLRRTPRLPVVVSVSTRSGAERGLVVFASRIGS